MKNIYCLIGLIAAAAGLSSSAYAIPELMIFDGTTTIVINDNGVGDSSSAAGRIVWNGAIGNWTLNTDVGTTFPMIGTLANPQLDLGFNAVNNGAGGTLTITFSADGFGPTSGSAVSSIGGTGAGTIAYKTFGGTNNTLFSETNLLTSQGPFAGAFSSSVAGGVVGSAGPYSLTQQVIITHLDGGITTGNALLTVPDSGSPLMLLGVGLTCIALMARLPRRFS